MKAILRVAKMKTAGSIGGKTDHNYRLKEVPNADPELRHLNREYVAGPEDLAQRIDARLVEAGVKVRKDSVRGMEFILTGSPEGFKRREDGGASDFSKSKWVENNLNFMKARYGSNLVAFTLHQDEKTPHIHAVVVPITPDNRLSAKELFNPKTLKQLQTDYALAVGMERGIEGSRARHIPMKQLYGQVEEVLGQNEQLLYGVKEPLAITKPSALDIIQPERYKAAQEAAINAEVDRRTGELKAALKEAQIKAAANAKAASGIKLVKRELETARSLNKALKQRHATELDAQKAKFTQLVTTFQKTLEQALSAVSVFVTMALSRITPSKESTLVTDSQKLLASKPNFIQHFLGAMTPPPKAEEIENKLERNRDQSRGFSR